MRIQQTNLQVDFVKELFFQVTKERKQRVRSICK